VLLAGQWKGKLFARAVFGDISARLEERKHLLTGIRWHQDFLYVRGHPAGSAGAFEHLAFKLAGSRGSGRAPPLKPARR
jgi:hypothetical protein